MMKNEHRTIGAMEISSPAFADDDMIPTKYTCDGEDVSPPLHFKNVPLSAKSLVLVMDDPDAPSGNWVHWLIWDISPRTKEIAENTVPDGATVGMSSFGKTRYGGPCPPFGVHRYVFTLYALARTLQLGPETTKQVLMQQIKGHVLQDARITGYYTRKSSID